MCDGVAEVGNAAIASVKDVDFIATRVLKKEPIRRTARQRLGAMTAGRGSLRTTAKETQAIVTGTPLPPVYIDVHSIYPAKEDGTRKQETINNKGKSGKISYHPPGSPFATSYASLTLTSSSPCNDIVGHDDSPRRRRQRGGEI